MFKARLWDNDVILWVMVHVNFNERFIDLSEKMNNPYQKNWFNIRDYKSLRSQLWLAQSSNSETWFCGRITYQTTCYSLVARLHPRTSLERGQGNTGRVLLFHKHICNDYTYALRHTTSVTEPRLRMIVLRDMTEKSLHLQIFWKPKSAVFTDTRFFFLSI